MNLPKHKCGLYLTHNEHRDYYESLEKWLHQPPQQQIQWRSKGDKAECISKDECWVLQWYPNTPIGFFLIAAPTLNELLEFAAEVEKTPETKP